jgi:hypothetical protein
MFYGTYTVQAPRGFMFIDISFSLQTLDENDKPFDFSLLQVVTDWFFSEEAKEYALTPHATALGIWLHLREITQQSEYKSRDLVFTLVKIKGEGVTAAFGLDRNP